MIPNASLEALPCVAIARTAAVHASTHEELMDAVRAYAGHPAATTTPPVPGRRGKRAPENPVMLLGKSPAAVETEMGLPLQGPAGAYLREVLRLIGRDAEEAHQTHATYWRPRKDNTPNATQLAFSRPFVLREIELVAPRRIIAFGAKAIDGLFGDHPPMDELDGREIEWRGIPVTCVRSHAYVRRFPDAAPAFVEFLRKAWASD